MEGGVADVSEVAVSEVAEGKDMLTIIEIQQNYNWCFHSKGYVTYKINDDIFVIRTLRSYEIDMFFPYLP